MSSCASGRRPSASRTENDQDNVPPSRMTGHPDDRQRPAPIRRPGSATLEVIGTDDGARWEAVLADVAQHDFHHLVGYHRLAEYHGEGTAKLFSFRSSRYLVATPLLLRPIDPMDPAGPQDATSVYGYAGPVSSHVDVPPEVVRDFEEAFREELVRRNVVAVFSRLHPLIRQSHLLAGLGEIHPTGPTVSVDLTLPVEEQWAGYSKGTRRLIRRALDAGVVCVHDQTLDWLAEWAEAYAETMRRVGASGAYNFDLAYFERMAAELGSVMHLFVALVDGRLAAGGLFTSCDGIVQAHLGALRAEYAALSPVRLVDDTARRWAADSAARVFHLGGGVGGREDSLFQYKAGFSDRRHLQSTWRWIVDVGLYERLSKEHPRSEGPGGDQPDDYFPAYRRPNGHAPGSDGGPTHSSGNP